MKTLKADTHVLVCDGANTILFKNTGGGAHPKLSLVLSQKQFVPPTRDLGPDAPSRVYQSVGGSRSSVEQPDLHEREEERSAHAIANDIEARLSSDEIKSLIVVAPPRFLSYLRRFFPNAVHKIVIAEIAKDLTKMPAHEIEAYLDTHLQ